MDGTSTTPDQQNPLLNREGTLPTPDPVYEASLPLPLPKRGRGRGVPRPQPISPDVKINGKKFPKYCVQRVIHREGYYHITGSDVKGLDKTALEPVEVPPKVVLRAWDRLGLDKKTWDKAAMMAMQEAGKYLSMKLTGRILLVKGMDCLGQVESALKWSRSIIESNHPDVDTNHKLVAVQMVALCAKSYKDLSDQLMDLAEKSQDKVSNERPRNLPPTVALQVNVAGAKPSPASAIPAQIESIEVEEPDEKAQ